MSFSRVNALLGSLFLIILVSHPGPTGFWEGLIRMVVPWGKKLRGRTQTRSWGAGGLLANYLPWNRWSSFMQNLPKCPFGNNSIFIWTQTRACKQGLTSTDCISLHIEVTYTVNPSVSHQTPVMSTTQAPPLINTHLNLSTRALEPGVQLWSHLARPAPLFLGESTFLLSPSKKLCCSFANSVSAQFLVWDAKDLTSSQPGSSETTLAASLLAC
jgi:hypothetical protein